MTINIADAQSLVAQALNTPESRFHNLILVKAMTAKMESTLAWKWAARLRLTWPSTVSWNQMTSRKSAA